MSQTSNVAVFFLDNNNCKPYAMHGFQNHNSNIQVVTHVYDLELLTEPGSLKRVVVTEHVLPAKINDVTCQTQNTCMIDRFAFADPVHCSRREHTQLSMTTKIKTQAWFLQLAELSSGLHPLDLELGK